MRLFKYRDLSSRCNEALERVFTILRDQTFWCARPNTLNDPEEFVWECDYSPSEATSGLLATVLTLTTGKSRPDAMGRAEAAILEGRLEPIARPVFVGMIEQCRNEIGLACFATSASNDVMWDRYGGRGEGVCIEIDSPDSLLHTQLHRVQYPRRKRLHVDQMLSAFTSRASAKIVYEVALLSKPASWAAEAEVRFVARQQDVAVRISDSSIVHLHLGSKLIPDTVAQLKRQIETLPYSLATSSRGA
jgi:hypothetical protein